MFTIFKNSASPIVATPYFVAFSTFDFPGFSPAIKAVVVFVTEDVTIIARSRALIAKEEIRSFLAAMHLLGYQRQEIYQLLQEEKEEQE